MSVDFVHLHVHSHYSLLDGACRIGDLAATAREFGMKAMALTDHGYVSGAQEFYKTFNKAELKPIIGCEAYISPTTRFDRNPAVPHIRGHHLILLCENETGYHSLCKLISEAYVNGMYYKPRIDHDFLAEHHEGIIAMSACIGGEIPSLILDGRLEDAYKRAEWYAEVMGKNNFFLEIMDHGMEEEKKVNRALVEMSKKLGLGLVATNDTHYLKKEHAKAHEIMLCIQTKATLSDPSHFKFPSDEFYFKSPDEMQSLFGELPESLANTVAIAERCEMKFHYVPEVNHYPVFHLEDGTVPGKDYLREICLNGIPPRYGFDPRSAELTEEQKQLLERMDYELGIIDRTKYISYFLVVSDFIRHAKSQGIPVGPGRGSGAGSLVAYLSAITDIEPLRYNLLFERFLNPERVSPPDFDVDFCELRRGEVIQYVRHKYGEDSVAQICTYGTLKAKAAVKDVARVLGRSFDEGARISNLIPADPKMTIAKAKKENPEFEKLIESDSSVREVVEYAEVIEGLNRQLGIHAAGVIIGDQRLDNLVPLTRGAEGEIITQFSSVPCEELGLLKMDFLGLRTLTTINNAVKMIERNHHIELNMSQIPTDDPDTYALLNRGDTVAVFQLESAGMQKLCRQFGVETLEHIIALVAMYRPGPMQFIPTFIARKRGDEPTVYDHPKMEKRLKETYGIMVYQEQIMQVVQDLAGFSLGGADILRRAIGKKKVDVLAKQKAKFVAGCAEFSGIDAKLADQIWAKIETFAGYGFNKSHSAAYAFVSYQTAYLKAHYPVEFMSAVLSGEIADADKISFLINACREMRIPVMPPNVNHSEISFNAAEGQIVFGLGAIKGVGESAAGKIIESRHEKGPYKSFLDFCERCGSSVNSRMIEHLTRAGALDGLGLRRSQILAIAEPMMSYAAGRAADLAKGQGSLFDLLDEDEQKETCSIPIPDIPEFDRDEILASEKELLGFYVTGHPLEKYREELRAFSNTTLRNLENFKDNATVRVGALVSAVEKRMSKNSGKTFYILTLEDLDSSVECVIYDTSALPAGLEPQIGMIFFIEGNVNRRDESERPRLVGRHVLTLDQALSTYPEELVVGLDGAKPCDGALERIRELTEKNPGNVRLTLCVLDSSDRAIFVSSPLKIKLTSELIDDVHTLLGPESCRIKAPHFVSEVRPRGNFQRKNDAAQPGAEKH